MIILKTYLIFLSDIWNNNYLVGFYKDLNDAIDDINAQIQNEKFYLEKGDLKEYPSTFDYCFDTSILDIYSSKHPKEEDTYFDEIEDMWVRGFIIDGDELLEEIKKLKGE